MMSMKFDFEKGVSSPLFAGFFVVIAMMVYYFFCYLFRWKFGVFDIEEIGVTEVLTYLFYGFGGGVAFCCTRDFVSSPRQNTFFALMFLWFAALLREMGIQHWLTTHDSVITKTRFFTNPANPMYEKVIAGILMLTVLAVTLWVLFKYIKYLVSEKFNLKSFDWTVGVFWIVVIITQYVDRLPANYYKAFGVSLNEPVLFVLKILEEGGESLLPLLFAIAFIQYHFYLKNQTN